MTPTLGRIVHYRLLDRWVAALVVGEYPNEGTAPTLLLLPWTSDPHALYNEVVTTNRELRLQYDQPGINFTVGPSSNDVFVTDAVLGEKPGNWRWPPRTE